MSNQYLDLVPTDLLHVVSQIMDLTSSSSSSDEEVINLRRLPLPRVFRERKNPFTTYTEEEFQYRYRIRKQTVMDILNVIGHNFESSTRRNHALSAMNKLLITLRFYATGTLQIMVGDDVCVHKTTICRIIKTVTHHIALMTLNYINMPSTEEGIMRIKEQFFKIRKFPGVFGCIDGTHIPIQSPGGNNEELYRNRKGYFSINVQVVCSADLRFLDIVARWPGSVHDSTVFNASHLRARLEAGEFPQGYLLGDSAYACKKYLLTPLQSPSTEGEMKYNAAHIQTRNTVERSFGVWKRRFPAMSLGMRTTLNTTLAVIVATAVLHNIAIETKDNFVEVDLPVQDVVGADIVPHNFADNEGNALRASIINTHFS